MIDAHHHFWNYDPAEYGWIGDGMEVLKSDFLPADLEQVAMPAGVTGVVSVQARESVADTAFLLEQARECELVKGVVGWVPLALPEAESHLEAFRADPNFKGVREVIQGREDGEFFKNEDFHRGMCLLTERGLPYDLLIFEDQLEAALRFVDRHPEQHFIVDHIAKPVISAGVFSRTWEKGIRELARRGNVVCKFSGVVTEVRDAEWKTGVIRPYFETVLEAFGAERLMFGSDWPVCLLRTDYAKWVETCRELAAGLSVDERRRFFEGTAAEAYRL